MTPKFAEATRLWTLAVPSVSAFLLSLLRDLQDRDDVLQETAIAVMQSYPRYDHSLPFLAWALGIARNQARLHLRKKGREKLSFDSETIDRLALAFSNREAVDQRYDHLADCVESLEPRQRDICRLRYEQNLKPASIAERLGMAANTVAKSLQRIREWLRACVERKLAEGAR